MTLIDQYLDLSEPDPPLRIMPSIRVSHIIAHYQLDPVQFAAAHVASDFGIPREAVFVAMSYYLRHRDEINRAIVERNAAYQNELGNA